MNRRAFFQQSTLASTALLTPGFLQALAAPALTRTRAGKILIVLQLSGGNDGLNTIVPYADDRYYQHRPVLGIPRSEVLPLNDVQGLHPALAPLRPLYDRGELTILNGVGYPNPDRSHFRSMDIWQTGSSAREAWSTGWIGRYLDSACADKPVYHALEVDDGLSLALKGATRHGFAMSDAQRLKRVMNTAAESAAAPSRPAGGNLDFLYKTMTETSEAAGYLYAQSRLHQAQGDYPSSPFGRDLRQIAELITADTATSIYYASLSGFDTHAGQKGRQQRLLTQYAQGVAALVADLKRDRLFDDVLILTFSEFGRRLRQNASGGTDHGTANNVLLLGGGLRRAGFYNAAPDLDRVENGDLVHQLDFRSCYATILDRWLEGNASHVLRGEFPLLDFV